MFICMLVCFFFFFSSRRRHTRYIGDWSSDVCSSDLYAYVWESIEEAEDRPPLHRMGLVRLDAGLGMVVAGAMFWFILIATGRSEERRVGKECRCGWSRCR